MAINTNKTSVSHEYYCLINEVQYGPYDVSSLITKIDRNTLVWREGIDWIKASEVIELCTHKCRSPKRSCNRL